MMIEYLKNAIIKRGDDCMSKKKDFCTNCRKECEYVLEKRKVNKVIKDKEYEFDITVAVCKRCGEEMDIPGLLDRNIKEVDEQYRYAEGIVTIYDIERMMDIYKIGKAPLSYALGFGEITITRYLEGQVPSKEYSDIIKKALSSSNFMKKKLEENKSKIAHTAYKKAYDAADEVEKLFNVSSKMLEVISYIFKRMDEVTPLMLQKLLHYVQGINLALNGKKMFPEDCSAWAHGPVYKEVYYLFKDFKYNPIEDVRFAVFDNKYNDLKDEEKKIVDIVVNSFGMYSGKTLERITHKETPWLNARKGYGEGVPSDEIISIKSIKDYFVEVNKKYNLLSEDDIIRYISDVLG